MGLFVVVVDFINANNSAAGYDGDGNHDGEKENMCSL